MRAGVSVGRFLVLLSLGWSGMGRLALAQDANLRSMVMEGTIGPYRVGLNYTVRDNTELVAAHYFYVSQGKDIALTGETRNGGVEWKGADGSAFHLRFAGNEPSGKPLTFYTSIGLEGTWVLGGKTLPVSLTTDHSTEDPGQPMYGSVTADSDAVFEAKVEAFRRAVLAGDRAMAMRFVDFPLEVNGGKRRVRVLNAAQLQERWGVVFSPAMLARMKQDGTHEMFVRNGMAMLGNGELWFNAKGLTSVNLF